MKGGATVSIFEIGMLYILVSLIALMIILSKYFNKSWFPKFLRDREYLNNTVFYIFMVLNYAIIAFIIEKIDGLYIARVMDTLDISILIIGAVLAVLIVSIFILIEYDNLILHGSKSPYNEFYNYMLRMETLFILILVVVLSYLVFKN